jgi:hypothetical protein
MIPVIQGDVVEVFEPEQGHIDGNRHFWERLPYGKNCGKKADENLMKTFAVASNFLLDAAAVRDCDV